MDNDEHLKASRAVHADFDFCRESLRWGLPPGVNPWILSGISLKENLGAKYGRQLSPVPITPLFTPHPPYMDIVIWSMGMF